MDLLTYGDLQLLRTKKAGTVNASALKNKDNSNKRYLILTYAVEFDRVHYPLPLLYTPEPGAAVLKRTIDRLRNIISKGIDDDDNSHGSRSEEIKGLASENDRLKRKLHLLLQEFQEFKSSMGDNSTSKLKKKIANLESALDL